jgi:integrase
MAIKLPSHLHRSRSGILHFRIAIPPDLRHHFASREIYRSLSTASVRDAALAAQMLSNDLKRVFTAIRQQTMSDQNKSPQDPLTVFSNLPDVRARIKQAGIEVRLREQEIALEQAEELLADSAERLALVSAQHERELALVLKAASATPAASTTPSSASTALLSAYVNPYLGSFPKDQRPNDKSLEAYRAAINTFIKIVCDKPLSALAIQDQNRFEDVIVKLPVNSTKVAATRGLEIDEMLALNLKPISLQNAKNIARRANMFLTWAFRRVGGKPPFQLLDTVRVNKKLKSAKKRRAFTDDELRAVFNPATLGKSTQASPYMFWLPLIGVHTGMRINEIAQLLLSDLVVLDGVHCFNVTDAPDPDEEPEEAARAKTIKTEAGKRIVPVHARLADLGLLEYADALKSAGHVRFFPDLVGGRDGPGQPASKQFGRYCDRIKLTDSELVFHSFRHGAVGRMRSEKVAKELRMVVVGHSAAEDTHDDYGDIQNDYSVRDKLAAIASLNFDGVIDYAALAARAPTMEALTCSLGRQSKHRRKRPD